MPANKGGDGASAWRRKHATLWWRRAGAANETRAWRMLPSSLRAPGRLEFALISPLWCGAMANFFVTGFGPFSGVEDNPTAQLIRLLDLELERRTSDDAGERQRHPALAAPLRATIVDGSLLNKPSASILQIPHTE